MLRKLTITILILASFTTDAATIIVEKNSPIIVNNNLKENVGIETLGGVLTPLLNSGCKLPCESTQVFSTAEDNQNQIVITLIRGLKRLAKDGVNLGKFQVTGISPAPRGVPEVEVTFKASDGDLLLIAKDKNNKNDLKLTKIK